MNQVAKAAGVSCSTVSKALRNDPTIPCRHREEIKAVAERLHYRPNPLVAALMSQLHTRRRRCDPASIAWVDLWTQSNSTAHGYDAASVFAGAGSRARELGYAIDIYPVANQGISPARLRQILGTRSQRGVLFPPAPDPQTRYPLDMTGLTGVSIGTSMAEPVLNRVSHNHYQGCTLACQVLRRKGFRRIGLVVTPWGDERIDGKWRAAYLVQQERWPENERIPKLMMAPDDRGAFLRWYGKHRPDAILIEAESHISEWLSDRDRVRLVWLGLDPQKKHAWGVNYRWNELGRAAVELLIGQIHQNSSGSPAIRHMLMIDGEWLES